MWVDLLTKQIIVEPTHKTITAAGLAELMRKAVFRTKGLPRKLVSDRDPRFVSEFWQELFKKLGTHLNISTSSHPQTDGQTERMNRSLEQMLRCYVHPLHDNWVPYLPTLEFAYNSHVNASTGLSPFLANYGFEPLNPVSSTLPPTSPPTSVHTRLNNLRLIHKFARTQVEEAQARFKDYADQRRLPAPFKIGDWVRVSTADLNLLQHPTRKLRPRFIGPCQISEQLSDSVYRLRLPPGAEIHDVFHASKLEKWAGPTSKVNFPVAQRSQQFYVDEVTDVQLNRSHNGLLFKVKWSGYPEDEAPWQPLRNVKDNAQFKQFLRSARWRQFQQSAEYARFYQRFRGTARIPPAVEDACA